MRACQIFVALVLAALAAAGPARADRIIASLSADHVRIASNFTGTELVLFGVIERDPAAAHAGDFDVVVTVKGPAQTVVTRRKERVLGLWVNAGAHTFANVPSYLTVLASKSLAEIVSAETRDRLQIGLANVVPPAQIGDAAHREALVRLRTADKLYLEDARAVSFLTPTVFRATIPLPAEVPIGTYGVSVMLLAAGTMAASADATFEIAKVGFAEFVVSAARDYGLAYGLASVAIALMIGWLASIVFRRD